MIKSANYSGLLDPRAARAEEQLLIAARPRTLDRAVLGLLDNTKANANHILARVEQALRARFVINGIVLGEKNTPPYAAGPASEAVLSELSKKAAVVVNAVGD